MVYILVGCCPVCTKLGVVCVYYTQVTTMYENVQREKEALVGKLAAVETEAKSVREQLASSQESCSTAVKVCTLQLCSCVPHISDVL